MHKIFAMAAYKENLNHVLLKNEFYVFQEQISTQFPLKSRIKTNQNFSVLLTKDITTSNKLFSVSAPKCPKPSKHINDQCPKDNSLKQQKHKKNCFIKNNKDKTQEYGSNLTMVIL